MRKSFEGYNPDTDEDEDLFTDTEDESPEMIIMDGSREQESMQIDDFHAMME